MGDRSTRGRFVVFEGIDLSGKTTQVELLRAWLCARGERAIVTQEPSEKGLYGRHLRMALQRMLRFIPHDDPLSEEIVRAKLFALDRFIHLKAEIEPHLAKGTHVLCDRYYLSSLVYQTVALGELGYSLMPPLKRVMQLNADALYARTQPDLVVLVGLTLEAWTRRQQARLASSGVPITEIYEAAKTRESILALYNQLAARLSAGDLIDGLAVPVVEIEQDESTDRETVHRAIVAAMEREVRREA